MNKFILNIILFIIFFLCAVGFVIASKATGIEIFKFLAVTYIIMTVYQLGWIIGFFWGKNDA